MQLLGRFEAHDGSEGIQFEAGQAVSGLSAEKASGRACLVMVGEVGEGTIRA